MNGTSRQQQNRSMSIAATSRETGSRLDRKNRNTAAETRTYLYRESGPRAHKFPRILQGPRRTASAIAWPARILSHAITPCRSSRRSSRPIFSPRRRRESAARRETPFLHSNECRVTETGSVWRSKRVKRRSSVFDFFAAWVNQQLQLIE